MAGPFPAERPRSWVSGQPKTSDSAAHSRPFLRQAFSAFQFLSIVPSPPGCPCAVPPAQITTPNAVSVQPSTSRRPVRSQRSPWPRSSRACSKERSRGFWRMLILHGCGGILGLSIGSGFRVVGFLREPLLREEEVSRPFLVSCFPAQFSSFMLGSRAPCERTRSHKIFVIFPATFSCRVLFQSSLIRCLVPIRSVAGYYMPCRSTSSQHLPVLPNAFPIFSRPVQYLPIPNAFSCRIRFPQYFPVSHHVFPTPSRAVQYLPNIFPGPAIMCLIIPNSGNHLVRPKTAARGQHSRSTPQSPHWASGSACISRNAFRVMPK